MKEYILSETKDLEARLISLRREFHKFPEIGSNLPKTREIVCRELDRMGIEYKLNSSDDGVVAEIKGAHSGKTIAFRADVDALHIVEQTNLDFSSEISGQMHGCGHDAHGAMLLCAAEILNNHKNELNGCVRLIFQAGEETGTGAKNMIAEGALDGVDAICALHVGNLAGDDLPTGTLAVLPGPVSAGKDKFTVTVHGKGTHSAFPEKGVDPILIASRIVNACEEIQARELSAGTAAVLSFGSFNAGLDHNSIPETAVLKGSIRVQSPEVRSFIGERLITISKNISEAFRASCDVDLKKGSATVMNNEKLAAFVADACTDVLGKEKVVTQISSALMGSDDFANYASKAPGVYFFLCTNNSQKGITEANHNPAFTVDESVLWEGVAAYVAIAAEFLK
ncbi:MAG: amidohydrolase [Ruminococcaceae bacterium]|nr:amidohydrolase [Oscillospiraceae bacterium]